MSEETDVFVRCFLDPSVFGEAHGAIVISGDFSFVEEKYGNRSMLFVPLEAGHAAQNIHLGAIESSVATLEIGSFVELLLSDVLGLKDHQPMTVIVFGTEMKDVPDLQESEDVEIDWAVPHAQGYSIPFSMAFAKHKRMESNDWSSGKDRSPRMARIKAIAEACEWVSCENVKGGAFLRGKIEDVINPIHPHEIAQFHPHQYRVKDFPFTPFSSSTDYEWVLGNREFEGDKVSLMVDLVRVGYTSDNIYMHATSSGVAAHTDKAQAVQSGVLELIERDSFMISYLARLARPNIEAASLPLGIQKRIEGLRRIGFEVWIKDYSLDLAPVVFIFAQNRDLSFTMCASCCRFDCVEALDHALMEIECAVLIRLNNGPQKEIKPKRVVTPEDHGALYEQQAFFRRSDFLKEGPFIKFSDMATDCGVAQSWNTLISLLESRGLSLITIDHEPGILDGEKLFVVRSVIPGLVPLSFGRMCEPRGLSRIYTTGEWFGRRPVTYAGMPKFPHPFT